MLMLTPSFLSSDCGEFHLWVSPGPDHGATTAGPKSLEEIMDLPEIFQL